MTMMLSSTPSGGAGDTPNDSRMEDQQYQEEQEQEEEEEERLRQQQLKLQHEQELQFYGRFLRVVVLVLFFWFAMLFFTEHHDTVIVIGGLAVFGMWFLYMLTCICCNLCWMCRGSPSLLVPTSSNTQDNNDDDEETGLTSSKVQDRQDNEGEPFPYPFAETPERIRSCSEPISTMAAGTTGVRDHGPTNGTYTAIYSAVFFNRTVRSEGKLHLEFLRTHPTGWTIQGESVFGKDKDKDKDSRAIQDGFCNAKGELFYRTNPDTLHRGILDFSSSCMFEGEFQTKDGPIGRIVRLELSKANYYSSSSSSTVEMMTFSSSTNDKHFNHDDADQEEEEVDLILV